MSFVIQLENATGSKACFTQGGWLSNFSADNQTWSLNTPMPGWSLVLLRDGQEHIASADDSAGTVTRQGDDTLRAVFSRVRLSDGMPIAVRVKVTWQLTEDLLQGRITVEKLPSEYVLHAVMIPDVVFPYRNKPSLIVPLDEGFVIEDAARCLWEAPNSPGEYCLSWAHMQMFGWLDGDQGLYLDSRDLQGWIKTWRFIGESEKCVRIRLSHLAPRGIDADKGFELPYAVSLSAFHGGWYSCAQKYRQWALQTPWAQRGPEERRTSPLAQTGCWLWNRGKSAHVCPPAMELGRRLGLPVALTWYWWHQGPYDACYPEYFPPREGEASFRAAVKAFREAGHYAQVYTNGMSWDMELPSWQTEGKPCTIKREDGSYLNQVYNTWMNHRLAHTCGASRLWHDTIAAIAGQVKELGLNGIYLDQIAYAGGTMPCFEEAHGHTPGGGYYGTQGFRQLFQRLRKHYPELLLSSEATLENYLDLLDSNIILSHCAERTGIGSSELIAAMRPIPLFSAVYHGRTIGFGSFSLIDGIPAYDELWPESVKPKPEDEKDWPALCPDQFAMELARTVSFGIQPMVANLTMNHLNDPRFADDIEFLIRLCRCYHAHREWLLWGRLLPAGQVESKEMQIDFLARATFTQPKDFMIRSLPRPAVLHSEWQAQSGEMKAFLINYSRQEQAVSYEPPLGHTIAAASIDMQFPKPNRATGVLPARSVTVITLR